jgi:hypothetical protein
MSVHAWHTPQGDDVMPPAAVGPQAIERLGQDPRHRGLAHTPGAGEQVGVVQALRIERIGQGPHDMLLPDHLA